MSPVFLFLQFRISSLYMFIFCGLFLKLRYKAGRTAVVMAAAWLGTGFLEYRYFMRYERGEITLWMTFLEIFMIQAVPFVIGRYRDFKALFVGITAAVYVLAGNICSSMLSVLGIQIFWCVAAQLVVHTILLILLVWKVREDFIASQERDGIGWDKLCLIPALFYTAVYALTVWPVDIYEHPGNLLGTFCVLVLLVTSYTLIIRLFSQVKQEAQLRNNSAYLEAYAQRLKCEADLVQEKEMESAVLRHDMRHYTVMLKSCLEEGNMEMLRQILQDAVNRVEETKPSRYCENLAVNGVISHCAGMAKKLSVRFTAETQIPQKLLCNEFEFATVIANLLENAVCAAGKVEEKEHRSAGISARVVKGQMILEVSNTYREKPEISPRTGLPLSEKGAGHGYGMQSVQAFVRKNNAVWDYAVEDGWFCVRILVDV